MNLTKNKLKTAGYVIKRLRDNGFIVIKMFAFYAKSDPRRWTVLINPGGESVYMTYYANLEQLDESTFELNDGGSRIPKNLHIKTDSLEVIIEYLLSHGVMNTGYYPGKRKFIKTKINTIDEHRQGQEPKETGQEETGQEETVGPASSVPS